MIDYLFAHNFSFLSTLAMLPCNATYFLALLTLYLLWPIGGEQTGNMLCPSRKLWCPSVVWFASISQLWVLHAPNSDCCFYLGPRMRRHIEHSQVQHKSSWPTALMICEQDINVCSCTEMWPLFISVAKARVMVILPTFSFHHVYLSIYLSLCLSVYLSTYLPRQPASQPQ